jgi:hypothetical protein
MGMSNKPTMPVRVATEAAFVYGNNSKALAAWVAKSSWGKPAMYPDPTNPLNPVIARVRAAFAS